MAALMQGVQYGLSSQGNFHENKSLIFVKLTDSAYRAIEDYLRNKNRTSQHPTIQFLGNEGHLSFPSCESSHGAAGFNFSLSSNADIEGPQGSFECIQQTGSQSLESLGALQCKMHIQAKDDVYVTTRHRMAIATEEHKKNCTREIKPGGPGIGKKVKLPNIGRGTSNVPLKRDREHEAPSQQFSSNLKPSNGFIPSRPGMLNGGPMHTKPQGNNHAQKPGNPDIMKRPMRERLIHLLAVRTYKKPELFDRMYKDGLRERDKKCLTDVLIDVAHNRDNIYHLKRHVWNDIHEDWPFYSEQDKQMLKRRKPQNLTPPGSSDGGSSGSGQSPTSTHPGSPPSSIASNVKRPGYVDGVDGLPTKRPRISHYRRPEPIQPRLPDPLRSELSYRRGPDRVGDYDRRNAFRNSSYGNSNVSSSYGGNIVSSFVVDRRFPVAPENEENDGKHGALESVRRDSVSGKEKVSRCEPSEALLGGGGVLSISNSSVSNKTSKEELSRGSGVLSQSTSSRGHGGHHDNRNGRRSGTPGRVTSAARIPSPDIQAEERTATAPNSEYPEYLTSYTTICNSEQRSRYKADFNADYSEYRDLHSIVETVSQHFAQLKERLRQEKVDSPGWKTIKQQIMREYEENKRDLNHQEAKRRFQYLHEKLSHIKRLVLEYDSGGGEHY